MLHSHVHPEASGRRLGQLYSLAHEADLNDIVCGCIDRMSHKHPYIFVILYVNYIKETVDLFLILSINWEHKQDSE
jgi:hypothetical protein